MNGGALHDLDNNYLLGNSDAEHERLIRQAIRLAPVTERFFREAGIGHGHRVLDLGSGVGDVAMLLAQLVGPSGEVIGIERDARSINRARTRVAEAGLHNVTFLETDIADFSENSRFDVAVGRYILQFLPRSSCNFALRDRNACDLVGSLPSRKFLSQPSFALSAHLPLWSAVVSLHREVAVRVGVNTEMGLGLYGVFRAAGLPAPSMRAKIELEDVIQTSREMYPMRRSVSSRRLRTSVFPGETWRSGDSTAAAAR